MAVSPEFRDYILEMLAPLGGVTARRMFSGAGLYRDGTIFGLIAGDILYFKVDDANRPITRRRAAVPSVRSKTSPSPCRTGTCPPTSWKIPRRFACGRPRRGKRDVGPVLPSRNGAAADERAGTIHKRSVVIAGHATSVSIESEFWEALREIAAARAVPINQLIAEIDGARTGNLSSAIRLFVWPNCGPGRQRWAAGNRREASVGGFGEQLAQDLAGRRLSRIVPGMLRALPGSLATSSTMLG